MCGSLFCKFFDISRLFIICCPLRGERVSVQFAGRRDIRGVRSSILQFVVARLRQAVFGPIASSAVVFLVLACCSGQALYQSVHDERPFKSGQGWPLPFNRLNFPLVPPEISGNSTAGPCSGLLLCGAKVPDTSTSFLSCCSLYKPVDSASACQFLRFWTPFSLHWERNTDERRSSG